MKPKKKSNKALIRKLREDLHYWQTRVRLDANSLKSSREKCKQIGAQMRALQKGS